MPMWTREAVSLLFRIASEAGAFLGVCCFRGVGRASLPSLTRLDLRRGWISDSREARTGRPEVLYALCQYEKRPVRTDALNCRFKRVPLYAGVLDISQFKGSHALCYLDM